MYTNNDMKLEVNGLKIIALMSSSQQDIVSNLSFSVFSGGTLSIVGESGSGKTMSALAIFGLLPDNCEAFGEAKLDDVNLIKLSERKLNKMRGRDIVYIPQSGADFLNPSIKIKTQIYESLKKNGIKGKTALKNEAKRLLNAAGLEETEQILSKYPFQVSGGQAQRVVLAMSLVGSPKLVIADEPTKGIDAETANRFLDKLGTLFSDAAVIIITHDISVARRCEKTLVMKNGLAMEYGNTCQVFTNPKSDYTKMLLTAEKTKMEGENVN